MAILCLNASLETLQPLCYCRTHRLQGDLCHCLHKGSLQALQAVVTLLAFHVLQNSPQFTVQGFEVCTPQGPILGADEGQKVPPQPFWSCFGLVGRSQVLLEDPFLTTEEGHLKTFHNSCSTFSWYNQAPVSPLSCKIEEVSPPDGTPPTKPWRRKGDGLPATSERFPSPRWWRYSHPWWGCFCVLLAWHWRRCSALVHWITFKAGIRICPFE